ncbi:hypothetical protein HK103_006199 [Boothiomyces macroporosus]|uniref:RING-type domain-containing protein n=1 Tax=Boothiomyces macroporosus TaxID=261099 RepID=A0AAD5Y4T5_9FUNG|nr:hypothetical protein HK103_006199 [Boothiomyces macroporosus]
MEAEIIEIHPSLFKKRKRNELVVEKPESELEVEMPENKLAVEIPSSPEYWNTMDNEIIVIQSSDDENESNCLICFEDLPGYSCPKHSLCKGCFSQYISTELDKPLAVLANSKGKIKCPKPDCNSYYSSKQITGGGMIDKYIQIVYKLGEMEGVNSAPALQIDSLRTRLEEALNLTCPWCRAVFVDYDGCDAVICSKSKASVAQANKDKPAIGMLDWGGKELGKKEFHENF